MKKQAIYLILIIFAVIVVGYLSTTTLPGIGQKACTMEAKVCPDGSTVGRSGPNCEFAACPPAPMMDEATAVKKYLTDNIATVAPNKPVLGGSWYVVNMTVSEDTNIGTVVYEDGHIQSTAQFTYSFNPATNAVTIDKIQVNEVPPKPEEKASAKINQTILVNGIYITPLKVLEDSRCAVDVQCIWAGRVTVNTKLENRATHEVKEIVFTAGPLNTAFSNKNITLVTVQPEKNSKTSITPAQYVFTYSVK